jgi:hypothetical protein
MANTIDWGVIYCSTYWGDVDNEQTLHIDSQPSCFV